MGTRRKSREMALQMLFQADLAHQELAEVRRTYWAERAATVDEATRGFTDDIFRTACERRSEIDALVERHAEHWRMDRMSAVDRNILRAGVAELLGFPATPAAVIINEALEVARKFSTPEALQFINGVLDGVAHELRQEPATGSQR